MRYASLAACTNPPNVLEPFRRYGKLIAMLLLTSLSRFAAHHRWAGLLLIGPLLIGADNGYLREIENEAKQQAATLITGPAAPEQGPAVVTDDRLATGLDQSAFDQALRENLPGTYAFYQQLSAPNRQKVYTSYQKDNRLSAISQQIIQLTSDKP
ncbi:MAG: hypothetical protein EKK68_13200 [Candidatus Competibacteraceae bacterium]|nr:MAG: hypothetical protein EKK68_13200 [Candidatus Competibacteraceae bacterium]